MAQMNVGRYEHFAAQDLKVKGPGTLGTIENSVFGVLPLDAAGPVEFWHNQRIEPYQTYEENAAVAGQFGGMEIYNAYEDQLIVIEKVILGPGSVGSYVGLYIRDNITFPYTPFFPTPMEAYARDTRNLRGGSFAVGTEGNVAAFPPTGYSQMASFYTINTIPTVVAEVPVVLGYGGGFAIQNFVANATTRFGIQFHIRYTA